MSLLMSDDLNEELLQERLQILLRRLRWSYINLWTLNPRTRVLEWTRGHFEVVNAKAGAREYAQLFYTTYKPCCCTPGVGAVGRANLEGKHIWLTGDAVCQHAGSVEQSQFLQCAEIKTTMCIPWVDSVLEIGTINVVPENLVLTDRIQQVLTKDLLSIPPADFEHVSTQTAPAAAAIFPGFHQDAVPRVNHPTNLAFQQVWRSANSLSLSLNSDISKLQPNAHTDTDMVEEILAFGQEAGAAGRPEIIVNRALNQRRGLMTDQYRSLWSGGGEGEGSSARTYSVSPELQQQIHANPGFSADDRISTSGTLHSQFPGPRNLNQIRRTNSCGDQYEIQKSHTLYEAQETRQQLNSTSELAANTDATDSTHLAVGQNLPFQGSWQRDIITSPNWQMPNPTDLSLKKPTGARSNVKLVNQVSKIAGPLLRGQSMSALELLKDEDVYQKEAAAEVFNMPYDVKPGHVMREPQRTTHVQITRPSPQGSHRRSLGVELASSSGLVHAGHDVAAANHMLAERRRRTKQKENFTALRRLVPIISKADKASTLIDAITYLKLLEAQFHELKASKEDIDQRCAILENKCSGLRDRNQELVEMLAKEQPPPGSAIHLNLVHLNLKSMDSSKNLQF